MPLRRIRARILVTASVLCSLLLFLLAMMAPSGGVAARPQPSVTPPEDTDDPLGMQILRRAAEASSQVAYKGVQFVSSWNSGRSDSDMVNVTHVPGEGTSFQTVATAAAPTHQTMLLDAAAPSRLGLDDRLLSLLDQNYQVERVGHGEVCEREVTQVSAVRGDGTVAARFWIDDGKGVLLRRETLDSAGRVTQASAFVSVMFGAEDASAEFTGQAQPRGELLSTQDIEGLRQGGWHIPSSLPDNLALVEARSTDKETGRVLHLSYSEGLSLVSVFVQRGRLSGDSAGGAAGLRKVERNGRVVYVSDTVQYRRMWESGGYVYTVLADAPPAAIDTAVSALPRAEPTGFWHRVERGFARIVSWIAGH